MAYRSGTMRTCFKLRDTVQGFGYDRNSRAETRVIPINTPTAIQFIISGRT
jgi:hypothetical protein